MSDVPKTPNTPEGFKAIHRHLFGELYEWAGELRRVNILIGVQQKDGSVKGSHYMPFSRIEGGLSYAFDEIRKDLPKLKAEARKPPVLRSPSAVANILARHAEMLIHAHPFRDGNGRSTRAQLANAAREAGFTLDESKIDRETWMQGSREMHMNPEHTDTLAASLFPALTADEAARGHNRADPERARGHDHGRDRGDDFGR